MSVAAHEDDAPAPMNDFIYKRLLKERIIWLGSEVREDNANAICAQLLLLAAQDPDCDIYLYLNSPGGSVTAGMAIYDTMQYIKPDVVTVAMGMAASMGQFLLTAGAPGKRFATPHTRILMHQPLGGVGGTASEVRINAQITAQRTGKSLEQITADADRDHWYTAPEALEYGFIDAVVDSAAAVKPAVDAAEKGE